MDCSAIYMSSFPILLVVVLPREVQVPSAGSYIDEVGHFSSKKQWVSQ